MIHLYKRKLYDTVRDSTAVARLVQDDKDPFTLAAYEVPRYPSQQYAMVMHRRRRRLEGKEDTDGEEDEEVIVGHHELMGFPFLFCYESTWSCQEMRRRLWSYIRPILRLEEGEERRDTRLLQHMADTIRVRQVDSNGNDVFVPRERTVEEEAEGSGVGGPSGGGSGSGGSDEEDETKEDPSGMAVDEEDSKDPSSGSRPASTSSTSGAVGCIPDNDDMPVSDVFSSLPGGAGLVYLAIDWEGPMEDRYGLSDDIMTTMGTGNGKDGMVVDDEEEEEEETPRDWLTLEQCLKKSSSPERLDRDNLWYCNRCKDHMQGIKTLQIWRLPRVMVIMLKRFHSPRERKLETLVDFPIDGLDMTPHVHDSIYRKGPPQIYDLFAVTNHYGSRNWGHYTAFARRWDGTGWIDAKWYRFDDSHVERVDESRVVSKEAYILFYRRREVVEGLEWPLAAKGFAQEEEDDQVRPEACAE